eukprot:134311-Pyramimonas_sp.AAC.1
MLIAWCWQTSGGRLRCGREPRGCAPKPVPAEGGPQARAEDSRRRSRDEPDRQIYAVGRAARDRELHPGRPREVCWVARIAAVRPPQPPGGSLQHDRTGQRAQTNE